MMETVRQAVVDSLRDRYGSGATVEQWGSVAERTWSWQIPLRVAGTPHPDMRLKIPRWEDAPTLERALEAGPQPSTAAEFDSLLAISEAVAGSGDPGLSYVEPVAYVEPVNAILMGHFEGDTLRREARLVSRGIASEVLFERTGRLVSIIHEIGEPGRRRVVGRDLAAEATDLADTAGDIAGGVLASLLRGLAAAAGTLDGIDEPYGNRHGDFYLDNVLVDQASRVAVIDPNPSVGPQLYDVALFIGDIRFERRRLASGGLVGGGPVENRVAAFMDASGRAGEAATTYREALALGERWLRIETETTGVRRTGLALVRRMLRREFSRRVDALSG